MPLSASEASAILLQEHACKRKQTWSKRLYRMELQQKRIDMINTVREEMRDQARLLISSVESDVVVAVLLLSIGFGFACEGTFPKSEADGAEYSGIQQWALEAYSTLLALSLVFPLGALVLTLAARAEAELYFKDVSKDLSQHIRDAMGRITSQAQCAEDSGPGSPDDGPAENTAAAAAAAASGAAAQVLAGCGLSPPPRARGGEVSNFVADERLVSELAQGLIQRVRHFHTLFRIARVLIFCGLLSAVMTCSVMLGITFSNRFPSCPWVWRCYSGTVTLSACGCVVFAACMRGPLRRLAPPRPPRLQAPAAHAGPVRRTRVTFAPLPTSPGAPGRGHLVAAAAAGPLGGLREPLLAASSAAAAAAAGRGGGEA